jgi:hypothetical protein
MIAVTEKHVYQILPGQALTCNGSDYHKQPPDKAKLGPPVSLQACTYYQVSTEPGDGGKYPQDRIAIEYASGAVFVYDEGSYRYPNDWRQV